MLSFDDAKRILKTVERNHGKEAEFIDLYNELFTMLEETTAAEHIDLQERVKELEMVMMDLEEQRKAAEEKCEQISKAYHEAMRRLDNCKKPSGKRGRPPKNPENAKVETFATDLEDLEESFGIHKLATEIFGGEE